jgi:hypothetical protein
MVRPSDWHSRAAASRRSMMGLACPKMGLAGQGPGFTGKPSWPPGRSTSGIPFENHANFDRAALGEIVAVVICLIASRTQQYRCRGGRDATSASDPDVGWLIRNALTFSVDARFVVGLAAVGSERRDARSDFINQRDRFWFAFCGHVAPIAFVIAGSGESGRGRQQAENLRGFELLGDEPASRHV